MLIVASLQNKCVRTITFSDFRSSANPICEHLGLLKVNDIIKYQQMKLAYDYFENQLPDDLCQLFTKHDEMQSTNMTLISTSRKTLSIPPISTEHSGRKSLRFQTATLWNHYINNKITLENNIYSDLNKIKSGSHFKSTMKKHFRYTYTIQ